jgi:RNA-directed DNA polymerase
MHATGVLDRAAAALTPMGLRLSASKTRTVHIDEGFDFLGWRIQRQRQPGSNKQVVYTWPSKKSLASVKAKVRTITRGSHNQPLASLLRHLNPVLRGWTTYFRHGVSAATFAYLRHFTWRRVVAWLRHKHPRASWKKLRRRYLVEGWWPQEGNVTLFNPAAVRTSRYRYRGSRGIPSPWAEQTRRAIT